MKIRRLLIEVSCSVLLIAITTAKSINCLAGMPKESIKIYPEPGNVENLEHITIRTEDLNTFGAFVYMPTLYSVNEDGSLGMEVSACELMDASARGKKELQFKVLNPPVDSGKYAIIIKNNSFSLISVNNNENNTISYQADSLETNSRTKTDSSSHNFKNFPVNLEKDTLRILHLSNSYGKDLLYYVNELLKAAEVDLSNVLIERLRYTNGSFKCWNDVFKDENTDTYMCYHMAGGLNINVTDCEGGKYDGSKFRMILDNPWDLIILNQASTYAPYPEQWNSNGVEGGLPELLSIIREYHPEVPIGFLLIHSYAEDFSGNTEDWTATERWERIRDGVEWLKTEYNIDFVIPYGTAIQNLRMTEYNNDYELTRDKTHLSNGLAKYTAGCCYFETLFSPRYKKSVWGNSFRVPHDEEYKAYEIEVDDASAEIGQKAAFLASHNMYEIRNPHLVDLRDYEYGEKLNQDEYSIEYNLNCPEAISDSTKHKSYSVYGPTGYLISNTMSKKEWARLPIGLYIINGCKIYKTK